MITCELGRMCRLTAEVAIAGAFLALVGSGGPASAAITQCDTAGPSNYFDGYGYAATAHSDNFEGASGYITIQPVYTCRTDTSSPNPTTRSIGTNFTTDWVMIADYDLTGWSQAGEIGGYNGIGYAWAEVVGAYNYGTGACTDCFDRFAGIVAKNDRDAFTEKWQYCSAPTNNYCIESLFNKTTRITDTNFNPYLTYWTFRPGGGGTDTGWSPRFSGEKTYQASDILGTTSQHANFEFIGAQRSTDDVFELMPCELGALTGASRATYAASNCYTFDIWTTKPN